MRDAGKVTYRLIPGKHISIIFSRQAVHSFRQRSWFYVHICRSEFRKLLGSNDAGRLRSEIWCQAAYTFDSRRRRGLYVGVWPDSWVRVADGDGSTNNCTVGMRDENDVVKFSLNNTQSSV